jgi:Leucine-rich repeat (LRR) protein
MNNIRFPRRDPNDVSPPPSPRLRRDPNDVSPSPSPRLRLETCVYTIDQYHAPRPLAEIVQWLLQQQTPQLLSATESLRDRWRNDAATLASLRELTSLDLSACTISSFEDCSGDQYKKTWESDKLSFLLDCMPQLTSLDLRNSRHGYGQNHEEMYRDEVCDADLLATIGKLTRLQVLRVGAVCKPKGPDRRAAGCEGLAVLAGVLKGLTRLTELRLTIGELLDAFEGGGEELFAVIAGLPALRILHMNQRVGGGALPALPSELGALTGLQSIGLSGCKSLEKLPAILCALTSLQKIDLSGCWSLKELPAELRALKKLQKINLSGCKSLEKLPAWIGGLTALRQIDLSVCSSQGLGFSFCDSLKELPAELGALKELQKINLSGCRSLEMLPAGISGLTALREIDLSLCQSLKELPAELGALKLLQTINLSNCDSLRKLPAELGALTQLQQIKLDRCDALHTPPPHVARQGTGAVLEFRAT